MNSTLFIGVTSWNSELFLPICLQALQQTAAHLEAEIVVLDNCSEDQSQAITRAAGVELIVKKCNQGDALNHLFAKSKADYTLLIHADVVMLADDWFECCLKQMNSQTALVSPEDIGCGPMTRPFGKNMPESSFLLFNTQLANRIRQTFMVKHRFLPWRKQTESKLDFYAPHVTHHLHEQIQSENLHWQMMRVLHSNQMPEVRYTPEIVTNVWHEKLADLQYGLGNFYAIGDTITHYHNWYDRLDFSALAMNPTATTAADNNGFPVDYIKTYSERFLADYHKGVVNLPSLDQTRLEPKAL
ncbi:MAG: glycosyltransferase family 2 protein [Arenicella sp.]